MSNLFLQRKRMYCLQCDKPVMGVKDTSLLGRASTLGSSGVWYCPDCGSRARSPWSVGIWKAISQKQEPNVNREVLFGQEAPHVPKQAYLLACHKCEHRMWGDNPEKNYRCDVCDHLGQCNTVGRGPQIYCPHCTKGIIFTSLEDCETMMLCPSCNSLYYLWSGDGKVAVAKQKV